MTERGAGEEMKEERQSGGAERQLPQRTTRRYYRPPLPQEHPTASASTTPPPPPGKREHIDKVARFVAEEDDGQVEEILLKLLRLTRNQERWGFLSADDPHHSYYVRKIAERRRGKKVDEG